MVESLYLSWVRFGLTKNNGNLAILWRKLDRSLLLTYRRQLDRSVFFAYL